MARCKIKLDHTVLDKAGLVGKTNIVSLDITDRGPAGDASNPFSETIKSRRL